ncbi:hypothetical protein H8356DRAFT_1637411 [Neocallimastix lanati (nom. inval.)]|nr:hypothetical protein H8356DRAFT_1637411 [Neocallimastix sp. JGI-2020a]
MNDEYPCMEYFLYILGVLSEINNISDFYIHCIYNSACKRTITISNSFISIFILWFWFGFFIIQSCNSL